MQFLKTGIKSVIFLVANGLHLKKKKIVLQIYFMEKITCKQIIFEKMTT